MPGTTKRTSLDTETVVTAAAELVDRQGLAALTLTRLAAELGVSQPALYSHIDSHNDLIRRVSIRAREMLAAGLAEAITGHTGIDAVIEVARAWRRLGILHQGLAAASLRFPPGTDTETDAAIERVLAVLIDAVSGMDLSSDQRVSAARTLRSTLSGFTQLETAHGHPQRHDADTTFQDMLDVLCAGFRHMEAVNRGEIESMAHG